MKAVIQRQDYTNKQITGTLNLFNSRNKKIFSCKTLELPWLNNQRKISCIPTGNYECAKRISDKYKWSYHVKSPGKGQVKGRDWILIHPGNYYTDILGCILVGKAFVDLNNDGYKDVTSSVATVKTLLKHAGKQMDLQIKGKQVPFGDARPISDDLHDHVAAGDDATVRASALTIRRKGDPNSDEIPNVLPNAYPVKVKKVQGNWANVEVTFSGWVSKDHLLKQP